MKSDESENELEGELRVAAVDEFFSVPQSTIEMV
jgi:hypothetical protein